MSELKPWPLFGYAPGDYMCTCVGCGNCFGGDKRAVNCLECAALKAQRALARPAPAPTDAELVAELRRLLGEATEFWDLPKLCQTVRQLEKERALAPFCSYQRRELAEKLADIAAPHLVSIIEHLPRLLALAESGDGLDNRRPLIRDPANEAEAQRIYESWADQPGYVPWVPGGNSDKQEEARRQASLAVQEE